MERSTIPLYSRLNLRVWQTILLILPVIVILLMGTQQAFAAGGDFSITHRVADPLDYPSRLPNDPLIGDYPVGWGSTPSALDLAEFGDSPGDSVTSLAPDNLGLGQIVIFEYKIVVAASAKSPEDTIQFRYFWDSETTNNGDFGYDEDFGVIAAFVDTSDAGNANLDGDETVSDLSWTSVENDADPLDDQIQGTIIVSGLDAGDSVVIEVWVVLDDTILTGITGNVATGMIDAETSAGSTINVGQNTIPLLKVGEFLTKAIADVSIIKSDDPDPVYIGNLLTYEIIATNNAATTVANGVTITDELDPETSFVSASDGGLIVHIRSHGTSVSSTLVSRRESRL